MSTRGIIARSTGESTFAGRYHHWDSYPSGLGVAIVELYRGHFKHDLTRMLQVLLDKHPAGWSTIVHKDFNLKPGYTNVGSRPDGMSIEEFQNQPFNRRPQCYCHGHRKEVGWVADEKSDCGAEWAYVVEVLPACDGEEPEQRILHVLEHHKHADSGEYHWQEVGRIDLDCKDSINWTAIECGENFERCSHYAWKHDLVPRTCNLGTQTWLGKTPLDFHDAIAFIIEGKRYKNSGSGGDADFGNRMLGTRYPSGTWVQSLITGNGKRREVPVAKRTDKGFVPLLGVTWVYPPTKNNPQETLVTASEEAYA
jgi:hypothetical protein